MSDVASPGDELDPLLRRAVGRLRQLPPRSESARSRLRERLRRESPPARPRMTSLVRPAMLLAAASVVVIWAVSFRTNGGTGESSAPRRAGLASPVVFSVEARGARRVTVAGDFTGWSTGEQPMSRQGDKWRAELQLPPGRYAYAFRVDERWTLDTTAPSAPGEFGSPVSIIVVSNPH